MSGESGWHRSGDGRAKAGAADSRDKCPAREGTPPPPSLGSARAWLAEDGMIIDFSRDAMRLLGGEAENTRGVGKLRTCVCFFSPVRDVPGTSGLLV